MNKLSDPKKIALIRGEAVLPSSLAGGEFIMAEATNTRLMGVVGVHTVREAKNGRYHQLFYLDMEEYGLDDYESFTIAEGESEIELRTSISQLFGGLGGKHIEISEKEAVYLVCKASVLNKKNSFPLPEGEEEYKTILENPPSFDEDEKLILFNKISEKPVNDYALINYYIMREVGMDSEASSHLRLPEGEFDEIKLTEPGTLYRNEIEDDEINPTSSLLKSYINTSFIEDEEGYRLIRSRITITPTKITEFRIISDMRISSWEATNIMRRTEYLIHRDISEGGDVILEELKSKYPEASVNIHQMGVLMMIFREDNSHVAKKIYRLDSDVMVSIYFRFKGDILIAGFDPIMVSLWNDRVLSILTKKNLTPEDGKRYAFPEAVLGKFITGDGELYDDFLEFLQIFTVQIPT